MVFLKKLDCRVYGYKNDKVLIYANPSAASRISDSKWMSEVLKMGRIRDVHVKYEVIEKLISMDTYGLNLLKDLFRFLAHCNITSLRIDIDIDIDIDMYDIKEKIREAIIKSEYNRKFEFRETGAYIS